MNLILLIYKDSRVKMSLATNIITTLSKFVKISVNVQGVKIIIRTWLINIKEYDLLLSVS